MAQGPRQIRGWEAHMADTHVPLVPTETWNREVHRLLIRLFRARMVLAPLLAVAFCIFFLWDPVPWKLLWIAVTTLLTFGLSVAEYWRIRKTQPGMRTIQANLAAMLLMQTSMIYITGGIESPVLPVYVALGLITGLSLGRPGLMLPVTAVPVTAVLLFAAGAQFQWFPRATPDFFGLGGGFVDRPVYIWTKAGVIVLLMCVTSFIGSMIRHALEHITAEVAFARRGTLDALASRNQEILSVASTVAHELKNPLSSIQGLAQLMARNVTPGTKDHERLDVMRREISRMVTVLDEFRSFSRPLSGLSLERTALGKLLVEVAVLNEGTAEHKRIKVSCEAVDGVDVMCDPQRVKQALLNLVQNSLEAAPGGGSVELKLRVPSDHEAEISVLDNGPGLATDVRARLFTPGLTTKERGSGLGLVVSRSIAEQHGGRLTLENRPTGGCIATFTVPLSGPPRTEEQP